MGGTEGLFLSERGSRVSLRALTLPHTDCVLGGVGAAGASGAPQRLNALASENEDKKHKHAF